LGGIEYLGNAEVSEADSIVFLEEEILRFEIAVKNLLVVEVVDGEGGLGEPVEDLRFVKILALFLHEFDLGVHVPRLAIGHDDAEIALLVSEGIFVRDDVDVPQLLQQFQFVFDVLPLLLLDLEHLDFLQGVVVALLLYVLAQEDVARRTSPDQLPDFV
jgi:hypothetical protein